MAAQNELIAQLEQSLAHLATGKRTDTLARVAELFVLGSQQYSEQQVALFDDVFTRLLTEIEVTARAMLANRLAPVPNAPLATIRALAFDDEIIVAGPVLTQSPRLDVETLIANAKTKSQEHLLAISRRKELAEPVTDVLVERGDRQIVLSTVENSGARFSDFGFATLVMRSENDDVVAERVGVRDDIPRHHFLRLLSKASAVVRAKLEAANPQGPREIGRVVEKVAARIQARTVTLSRNYSAAQTLVESLRAAERLNDAQVQEFARSGQFEETVAALALLCGLSILAIERAMTQDRPELLLILAKASGLTWPTAKAILKMRAGARDIDIAELDQCLAIFDRMKRPTAEQALRFQQEQEQAGRLPN
jgi:uncharacterized protein (DUF2336 family)